jgi:uncharacterized protein (UPF0303 family)
MLDTLPSPTRSLNELAREERSFTFAHFTCEHAWVIGNILRNALRTADATAIIHISLSSSQTLFHAPSMPGMMPDDETWVARKGATVLRWGHSTWWMACRFSHDTREFEKYHGLADGDRGKYTIEGGGYPVFVKGVEGCVGAIVVAGAMDGAQAHQVCVKALEEYRELRNDYKSPMPDAVYDAQIMDLIFMGFSVAGREMVSGVLTGRKPKRPPMASKAIEKPNRKFRPVFTNEGERCFPGTT